MHYCNRHLSILRYDCEITTDLRQYQDQVRYDSTTVSNAPSIFHAQYRTDMAIYGCDMMSYDPRTLVAGDQPRGQRSQIAGFQMIHFAPPRQFPCLQPPPPASDLTDREIHLKNIVRDMLKRSSQSSVIHLTNLNTNSNFIKF